MRYLRVFSPDAHRVAVEALTHTVKADPDNPMALAMLCNAYCHDYVFDIGSAKAPLEEAERLTQQALALDPKCQMAHISEAFLRFLQGYDEQCIDQIRWAYSLNPLNSYVNYISALMLCMSDRMEEGLCLLENTLELDPNHSTLLNSISFMQHYQQGNYEKAWSYAKRLNTSVFWHPLIRAASAAQLGLRDKANSSVQELLAMRPDFSFRAQDLIRRFTYREEHIELLLDGLWKAGLKLHLA
jgi:tetratricopeptide (TPR) repeat protein